jgi:hypothetical protein
MLLGHGGREVPKLLGPSGKEAQTLLGPSEARLNAIYTFESVLGLACQPNPTTLGPATKARPNGLGQRRPRPELQFLTQNTGNERPLGCYNVVHSANTLWPQCHPQGNVSVSTVNL